MRIRLDRVDAAFVALLMLAFAVVAFAPFAPKALGDLDFHREAKTLSSALTGEGSFANVTFSRAPGPVLFYAVPYMFVRSDAPDRTFWTAGVAWTAGWMAVGLCLVRRAARRLASERAGWIAMLLALASPFSVYYSLGILAEGPAYLAVCWFLYGWCEASAPDRAGGTWPRAVMILGLTGLILCRPNAVLVLPLAAGAWLFLRRSRPRDAAVTLAGIVGAGAIVLAFSGLVSVLQGKADTRQSGYLAQIALQGRFQYRTETWDWRFWDSVTREGSRDFADYQRTIDRLRSESGPGVLPVGERTRAWVVDDTLAHPWLTLKMALVRTFTMHLSFVNSRSVSAFRVGPIPGSVVYWGFHAVVNAIGLGLGIASIAFLVQRRGALASLWPLWAPWLALIAFHAIVYSEPRYLLPAKCCQVVMAACVLDRLLSR